MQYIVEVTLFPFKLVEIIKYSLSSYKWFYIIPAHVQTTSRLQQG